MSVMLEGVECCLVMGRGAGEGQRVMIFLKNWNAVQIEFGARLLIEILSIFLKKYTR